jgi:hypothetical protein
MKGRNIFIGGVVLLLPFIFVIALHAFDDPDYPSFEANRKAGMDDCRTYADNFRSQGWLDDKAAFQDRFGSPVRVNEPIDAQEQVLDFLYNNYTKITLDCSGDSCGARCSPRF